MGNEIVIKLDTLKKINKYLDIVYNLPVDLDIIYGRYIIDGKSAMGLFGLDLSKNITLKIRTSDTEMVNLTKQALKDFIVGGD